MIPVIGVYYFRNYLRYQTSGIMKLFTAEQLKKWDAYTIKHTPISSAELMEKASSLCEEHLVKLIKSREINQVKVFCGSGDNGGDGYVIARRLVMHGYMVSVYHVETSSRTSIDNERNYFRLLHESGVHVQELTAGSKLPVITEHDLVIDALLGIGLNKPVEGALEELIKHINNSKAYIVAIDVPTGLPVDIHVSFEVKADAVIKASETLTFQIPKSFFLLPDAYQYTGEFTVLDIGLLKDFQDEEECAVNYITPQLLADWKRVRPKFSNKGSFGHLLIAAGSLGKMGAAVLSSKAALRCGCGLLTVHLPAHGNVIMQTALPEAMTSMDNHADEISMLPEVTNFHAIAIGPGMGTSSITSNAFLNWLPTVDKPIVLDADALNMIAGALKEGKEVIFPKYTVITPHPKEFDRLVGGSLSSIDRLHKQLSFAVQHNITIVLKGAHTSVATPEGKLYFNSTGNPLLATAGSGDVLTGMIASLLAQGYSTQHAAIIAVFTHGKCADVCQQQGRKTMIASDIIDRIPEVL